MDQQRVCESVTSPRTFAPAPVAGCELLVAGASHQASGAASLEYDRGRLRPAGQLVYEVFLEGSAAQEWEWLCAPDVAARTCCKSTGDETARPQRQSVSHRSRPE